MYPQLKKIKGNDAILKDRMTVFCQNEGRKELQKMGSHSPLWLKPVVIERARAERPDTRLIILGSRHL